MYISPGQNSRPDIVLGLAAAIDWAEVLQGGLAMASADIAVVDVAVTFVAAVFAAVVSAEIPA